MVIYDQNQIYFCYYTYLFTYRYSFKDIEFYSSNLVT